MEVVLNYMEEWDDDPSHVNALGLDRVHVPCGAPRCACHLAEPYVLMAISGKARWYIDKFKSATMAQIAAEEVRKHFKKKGKWKIVASETFGYVLEIEAGWHACLVKNGKHHKEDTITNPTDDDSEFYDDVDPSEY